MTDVVRKGERPESKIPQELLSAIMLCLILCALQQFQISLYGYKALFFVLNKACGIAVAALDPDKDIGIKYHGGARREDDPFAFQRIALPGAC